MSNIRVRAAALLVNNNNELLLVQHQKNGRKYWVLPGGGVHFGEPVQQALKREMQEELNIEVKVDDFIFMNESIYPDGSRHIINLYFSVQYITGNWELAVEERLADYAFFSEYEIPPLLVYPSLNHILVEYLQNKTVENKFQNCPWIT